MVRLKAVVISLGVVAGCAPVSVGGSGTSNDGSPVALNLVRQPDMTTYDVTLIKPGSWKCEATLTPETNTSPGTAIRQFPLDCGERLNGTAVATLDQFKEEFVVSFKLSNGQTGQAKIGG